LAQSAGRRGTYTVAGTGDDDRLARHIAALKRRSIEPAGA
jgi:hypothetical protein